MLHSCLLLEISGLSLMCHLGAMRIIGKDYFDATRGYVIYSPRAQPEVNKSHIHEVPENNWRIFHMGEVLHGQGINRDMILFVVLTHVH